MVTDSLTYSYLRTHTYLLLLIYSFLLTRHRLAKSKSYRYAVIGPDWPCALLTYVVIIVPSIFVYLYLVRNIFIIQSLTHSLILILQVYTTAEKIIFFIVFGLTIFGLTSVFVADPGLVRKYHHARTRHWTYCDHCESFRPPGTHSHTHAHSLMLTHSFTHSYRHGTLQQLSSVCSGLRPPLPVDGEVRRAWKYAIL